jgi:small subunit ribosomal protein S16
VVACDKRNKRDGKYIQRLGYFNPLAVNNAVKLKLDLEGFTKWIGCGAQMSKRVEALYKEFNKAPAA